MNRTLLSILTVKLNVDIQLNFPVTKHTLNTVSVCQFGFSIIMEMVFHNGIISKLR